MAAAGMKEKQGKTGDGSSASGERVLEQKQPGLYTVIVASDWRTAAPGDAGIPGRTDAVD